MVRAPAQTARGAGSSPAWCYSFPCIHDCSKEKNLVSFIILSNTETFR